MDYVEKPDTTFAAINIGTGTGASVFEVLEVMQEVTGLEINPIHAERRAGDPPALIADVSKAAQLLNWHSKFDLHDIVTSAWSAWQERG